MKKIKIEFALFSAVVILPILAFCQSSTPAPGGSPAPVLSDKGSWLLSLAASHPWIMSALLFIGGARLFLKPLFAALHTFFQGAGLVAYDQKETAIEQSKVMSVIFFVLDYLGSIKMPVAAKDTQPPAA